MQLVVVCISSCSAVQEEKNVDPFVIYNPVYSLIREEMSAAAYGRDYAALEERTAV